MIEDINRMTVSDAERNGHSFQAKRLTDINGHKATFEKCNFSSAHIVRGYFREAIFKDCTFIGCRFSECNFREAKFIRCDFKYAAFDQCLLPIKELLINLPEWPNVRRELIQNLRANVRSVGDFNSDHLLLQHELEAERSHWKRAYKQTDSYYKEKYGSFGKRVSSWLRATALFLDSAVWGHGFSFWKLTAWTAFVLALLICFQFLTNHCCTDVTTFGQLSTDLKTSAWRTLSLYVDLPDVEKDWVEKNRNFSIVVVMLRYISLGLFVTCFYRSVARN
jgi:hypothetical protein